MPMVWYIPPLSPVVDVSATPATTPRTAATCSAPSTRCASRSSTSPSCSPPATRAGRRACCAGSPRCAPTCATSTSAATRDESIAAAGRHDRRADRRHVPAAGHRQVRRALRHPAGARRAGARAGGAGHRVQPRLRGRPGHGRLRPVRRGLRRTDADRGGELPHARATGRPADTLRPAPDGQAAGSTCSTGTARAAPRACSRLAATRRRHARTTDRRHEDAAIGRPADRAVASPGRRPSLLLGYPDDELARPPADCCRRAVDSAAGRQRRSAGALPRPPGRDPAAPSSPTDYVATFDLQRRCCLYLTYYAHGDTRKRGVALLRFKHAYRPPGFELDDGELPDHLRVRARVRRRRRPRAGRQLLLEHRAGLELLRLALATPTRRGRTCSTRVCATLPAAAPATTARPSLRAGRGRAAGRGGRPGAVRAAGAATAGGLRDRAAARPFLLWVVVPYLA